MCPMPEARLWVQTLKTQTGKTDDPGLESLSTQALQRVKSTGVLCCVLTGHTQVLQLYDHPDRQLMVVR